MQYTLKTQLLKFRKKCKKKTVVLSSHDIISQVKKDCELENFCCTLL